MTVLVILERMTTTLRPPFAPAWKKGSQQSQYAAHYGIVLNLEAARRFLGVTRYKLGWMLGLSPRNPPSSTVSKWYSGHRKPNQLYMNRLLHLVLLQAKGLLDIETFDGSTYWEPLKDEHSKGVLPDAVRPAEEPAGVGRR